MPVSAETLRLLMDAGVDGDDLLRIVESIDNTPKPRSANAERQARHRERLRAAGVTNNVTNNVTESVTPHVRVEDNLQTKEISGQGKKKTARENLADFVSELSSILDADRVQALVEVRRTKGGKLNGHAARLLIAKIRDCGIAPAEAADAMALRNWISIEPEWLGNRKSSQATAPPPPRNAGELARLELLNGTRNDPPNPEPRLLEARDGNRETGGSGIARRFTVAPNILGRVG
jgi:hypothetical protein